MFPNMWKIALENSVRVYREESRIDFKRSWFSPVFANSTDSRAVKGAVGCEWRIGGDYQKNTTGRDAFQDDTTFCFFENENELFFENHRNKLILTYLLDISTYYIPKYLEQFSGFQSKTLSRNREISQCARRSDFQVIKWKDKGGSKFFTI